MLLDLTVGELEHLQTISVGRLRCLRLGEVVNNLAVWVRLLDVSVVEEDDRVAVSERFSANAIAKDDLLLSVGICALHFSIVAHNTLGSLRILVILAMVHVAEFHLVVLFFVLELDAMLSSKLFVASDNIIRLLKLMLLYLLNFVLVLLIQSYLIISIVDKLFLHCRHACNCHLFADLLLLILEFFHTRLHIVVVVTSLTRIQALSSTTAATLTLLSTTTRASAVEHALPDARVDNLVVRWHRLG